MFEQAIGSFINIQITLSPRYASQEGECTLTITHAIICLFYEIDDKACGSKTKIADLTAQNKSRAFFLSADICITTSKAKYKLIIEQNQMAFYDQNADALFAGKMFT